jgi:predicted component of type VI protein secretion system
MDEHDNASATGNDTTLHFATDFGAKLAAALDGTVTNEERDAIAALPSGSALLIADLTVAGRHPEADIFLDDVTVSRRHAEFLRHGKAFQVRDLGSLNGTYFDGVRIDTAILTDGSEVQVGKFRLTFYASRLDLAGAAPAAS